jgi:hypothetical protein
MENTASSALHAIVPDATAVAEDTYLMVVATADSVAAIIAVRGCGRPKEAAVPHLIKLKKGLTAEDRMEEERKRASRRGNVKAKVAAVEAAQNRAEAMLTLAKCRPMLSPRPWPRKRLFLPTARCWSTH